MINLPSVRNRKRHDRHTRRILGVERNEHDRVQRKLEFIEVDHIKKEVDQSRMCERMITRVIMQKRTLVSFIQRRLRFL